MTDFTPLLSGSLLGLMIFAACGTTGSAIQEKDSFGVMSYNLRFDTESDGINQWDNRKERVASLIRFYHPGFLGTQEGLLHQVEYLEEELEGYGRIGVGRDDGGDEGEFSAILFDENRFELINDSEQTLWLSETPEEPSQSWDAALPRILTFGKFRDRQTDETFYVFNTHFDHIGQTAREESSKLILKTIREDTEGLPVILMGDFNVTEDNPAYEELTAAGSGLQDAYFASRNPHVGPDFTFEGFEVKSGADQRRIDFIFVSEPVSVLNHAIISSFREGYYPSDHLPVYAEIDL